MKCFEYNKSKKYSCTKKSCRYWINRKNSNNCCIIASEFNTNSDETKFTLQDIGDIFNVTRMRICQIEKIAIKKLKDKFLNFE